jgi:hypothetical protein
MSRVGVEASDLAEEAPVSTGALIIVEGSRPPDPSGSFTLLIRCGHESRSQAQALKRIWRGLVVSAPSNPVAAPSDPFVRLAR